MHIILVKGNIKSTGGYANTNVAFKNCATFTICVTHINDEHIDTAENFDILMPMYNLIKLSDNYLDISRNLWQLKRDASPVTNADNSDNVSVDDSSLIKHK